MYFSDLHVNRLSMSFSSQEAAWTISNITAGQPHQIQCVLDYGLIPAVIDITIKVNHDSRRNSCMHLLRSSLVMQLLITAAGQISSSVHHWRCLFFSYQGGYKAQKEAVWAIKNLTAGGTIEQIMKIVMAGALKPLCDLLVVKETEIVTMILDTLINILNVSRAVHTSPQYL